MQDAARAEAAVDPALCWLYSDVPSAVHAHDQAARAHGGSESRPYDPPMVRIVSAPEAMIGTAIEPRHRVIQVCAGAEHGILLTDAGIAFTWGDNRFGQLGRAPRLKEEDKRPFPVLDLLGEEILQVAAGVHHCLALAAPGLVWTWGRNKAGQLGVGHTRDQVAPVRVSHVKSQGREEQLGAGRDDSRIVSIAAGCCSSVASAANGELWQWGEISENFKQRGEPAKDGGRSGAVEIDAAAPSAVKTRPFSVFKRSQFKATARRKAKNAKPTSISETDCRVSVAGVQEERFKDLCESVRQLQQAIASSRGELARDAEQRQRVETKGKGAESGVGELQELEETIAILQRDIGLADQEIDTLEKNVQGAELKQEHTRQQLNAVMQQSTRLSDTLDKCSLKMFDAKKGTPERKRFEERLAEIKKFVDANTTSRESLLDQKTDIDKEKQRIQRGLASKQQFREKQRKKLATLRNLSNLVSKTTGASDKLIQFLKERNDEVVQHFSNRAHEADFLSTMKELESDEVFLQSIEQRTRDVAEQTSDQVRALRSRLISDLLEDMVGLRRLSNELSKDKWAKEDLNLSCFFEASAKTFSHAHKPALR